MAMEDRQHCLCLFNIRVFVCFCFPLFMANDRYVCSHSQTQDSSFVIRLFKQEIQIKHGHVLCSVVLSLSCHFTAFSRKKREKAAQEKCMRSLYGVSGPGRV